MRCLLIGITVLMMAGCADGTVPRADAGPCLIDGFERHADGPCLCSSDRPACSLGQVCVSGLCVFGCRVTADCGDGEICLTENGHEAGQCVEEPVIDPCVDVVAVHEGDLTITKNQNLSDQLDPVRVEILSTDDFGGSTIQHAGGTAGFWLMWLLIILLLGEQLFAYWTSYHPSRGPSK